MQQPQGGDSARQYAPSQPLEVTPFGTAAADPRTHILQTAGDQPLPMGDPSLAEVAEAASPISSRPPALPHLTAPRNFEEFLPAVGIGGSGAHHEDEDAQLAGDDTDRGGGGTSGSRGGGGLTGGNRWPREETLALLKIRSDMDSIFRDATLKGPLWEDVSRKLAELGYKRSAKKCKEKFENVHKYYKRTKEGRAGRQDGKSYRFFSQLEALHGTPTGSVTMLNTPSSAVPAVAPSAPTTTLLGVANPIPLSVRMPPPHSIAATLPQPTHSSMEAFLPDLGSAAPGTTAAVLSGSAAEVAPAVPASLPVGGISFSSDSSSTFSGSDGFDDDDDEDDDEIEIGGNIKGEQASTRDRKRKRVSAGPSGGGSSQKRMMEFFEGLMKQVMQKQEAMQQRFLEAIEKRDQDRMIREEAWKRQEMTRLAREHELMAQERAMSASRDAAIISFIQKITGQTIPLPSAVTIPAAPSQQPPPPPTVSIPPQPQPLPSPTVLLQSASQQHYQKPLELHQAKQQQQLQQQQQKQPRLQEKTNVSPSQRTEAVMAIPEQQIPLQEPSLGAENMEASSSRWPKTEVLALINLRSSLESRYQEAGPKGPLWEEISAGMLRMGYNRNPKRCKEKWENINKYFKKVKESNKKRPEDAKTCPYFHQLDELYRRKILGGSSSTASGNGGGTSAGGVSISQSSSHEQPQRQQQTLLPEYPQTQETKNGRSTDIQTSNGNRGDAGASQTPEDIVMGQHQQKQQQQNLMTIDYGKIQEPGNDNLHQAEDEENYGEDDDDEDDDEFDEETEEEMKMAYKIQFQRQNTAGSSSNGGGNGASSFLAMVQ